MEERLILVTNDDGYDSRGMEAAVEVARTFGRVVVVAPETTQSGMSQAITMYSPLYLRSVREEEGLAVYAFSGTPVDCVKMAFDCLLRDERVDLVLSGINHGSNSAVNVLYSGTMGAAIEGSFYGCPAVGLSLDDHAADADFVRSDQFHLPTVSLRIFHIQTIHFRCKKRGFISARTRTDFHNNVFIIIRILGEQQDLHFLFQLLDTPFGFTVFFFQKLPHFLIGLGFQHDHTVLRILFHFFIFLIGLHKWCQIALFLHEGTETILIGRYRRLI